MTLAGKLKIKQNSLGAYRRFKSFTKRPFAKVSGLISLTILAVAFFGAFAILPTFRTIGQLTKEIIDAENVNSQLAKKIKALDNAGEVYEEVKNELEFIEEVLPKEPSFERLAWQIMWLGNKNGVEIIGGGFGEFNVTGANTESKKVKTTKETKTTKGAEITIDLTVQGEYQQLKTFIGELLKFDRLVLVEEINLNSKSERGQDKKMITANIKAMAHFLPKGLN